MVYRYDYDVKNNLIDLLETKQDFAGVLEMPYYLEPVSYTHLDVYKRQSQCRLCTASLRESQWESSPMS